ncbi:hypothetical protein ABEB36_004824 [Hypothenemus hampei]|uniref:Amino acid transporter transmembrane domain-containing protein n=1 Tax=Hypothenemus hampei TaxID=57062 RepID=A0ABD1EVY7_HYPHA
MESQSTHVITLANSIIGVSILAMPYCFKQCGIILSIFILLLSSLISRLSCHFLIKASIIARRKNFEYLAYYIFGGLGKFTIEIGIIGFLIGTCIAFFVVMGDLGPDIVAEITGQTTTSTMRLTVLISLSLFCVLPLGLLRNIDSFSGLSKVTIGFYVCLVMKIVCDSTPHLFNGDWIALSCQTQLFEIYHVTLNPSLEQMNQVIKSAVNICTIVYLFVGVFGYIAFSDKNIGGNILLSFTPSTLTTVVKLGFILSIVFSFPLVIFPCRASLHSLIYRQASSIYEGTTNYIPESRFKVLGIVLMILGTFENLRNIEKVQSNPVIANVDSELKNIKLITANPVVVDKIVTQISNKTVSKVTVSPEVRHEPPQPVEPPDSQQNDKHMPKNEEILSREALKKEDQEQGQDAHLEHQILIDKIQKQNEMQQEIVKQQKKLIEVIEKQQEDKTKEEKLKAVKEIESIALKAIEKISGDVKENEKIVAKLEKDVLKKFDVDQTGTDGGGGGGGGGSIGNASNGNSTNGNKNIKELKVMNELLIAKIKENNITSNVINKSGDAKMDRNKTIPLPLPLIASNKRQTNDSVTDINKAVGSS